MRYRSVFRVLFLVLPLFCLGTATAEQPVRGVGLRHSAGQTFITWTEANPPQLGPDVSFNEARKTRQTLRDKKIEYRIYRSTQPIASIEGLEPIATVGPLSGWNLDFYGDDRPAHKAFRYVIEDGKEPLPSDRGLCVFAPSTAGNAYYAVTLAVDGKEDRTLEKNTAGPIAETVGAGVPVLQRIVRPKEFNYVANPTLHYFTRWESPPNANRNTAAFDYLVAVPPHVTWPAPVGLHLHCWGGSLEGGYGWWYNAEKGSVLIATNQIPYDWWTGYHEQYGRGPREKAAWQKGVVRPYTQRRLFAFLDWAATRWDLDRSRTFAAGSSMGGSGSPMLAIRYPDRVAWAVSWVGVHIPGQSPQFQGSYAQVYGDPNWAVKFEDGTPVWDYYNDAWYLRRHPEKEIGLLVFSNGKNDGAIGWSQAAEFHRALQETHRPHVFVWGQAGHGQRATMPISLEERVLPIDVRIDQSLPAFSRCSLDDDPGDGDPARGDPKGQSNLYLFWDTETIVDRPDRWELTLGLIEKAPRESCKVDITPRRLQQFQAKPGEKLGWTLSGEPMQRGEIQADRLGLCTLPQVEVKKGRQRLQMFRIPR